VISVEEINSVNSTVSVIESESSLNKLKPNKMKIIIIFGYVGKRLMNGILKMVKLTW
jgi:hypothetical protein